MLGFVLDASGGTESFLLLLEVMSLSVCKTLHFGLVVCKPMTLVMLLSTELYALPRTLDVLFILL